MENQTPTTPTPHGRRRPVVTLGTTLVALAAWLVLFWHVRTPPTSHGGGHGHHAAAAMNLAEPGVPEAVALTGGTAAIGLYLLMWGTMMVAMMFPSSARCFQRYADSVVEAAPARRLAGIVLFVGTYTLVWTALGVVPLVVSAVVPIAELTATQSVALLGGTLVVLAGYQLSPQKAWCLRHCRAPQSLTHRRDESAGPIREALHVSVADVGSCWLLMGLLVVVGSMNLLWMGAVTVALTLERMAPQGLRLARVLGVFAGIAGLLLLAFSLLAVG